MRRIWIDAAGLAAMEETQQMRFIVLHVSPLEIELDGPDMKQCPANERGIEGLRVGAKCPFQVAQVLLFIIQAESVASTLPMQLALQSKDDV